MTPKTESKLTAITRNYINDNRRDAVLAIRKLTKVQIAELFININSLLLTNTAPYHTISKLDFEDFILQALETGT